MGYSQLSTTSFADTIGISRSGLTHLLTGRNQPSLDVARKILAKYPEISTEWLIMGMGDMFRTDNQDVQPAQITSETTNNVQHPDENLKMMKQTDLFGEYETQNEPEEDVPAPNHSSEEVDNGEDVEEQEVLNPQPVQSSMPAPAPTQVTRVRMKSTPASSKREKSVNNVPERKLQKIVFFYDDHSFEIYNA